jgi:hypothetical protein
MVAFLMALALICRISARKKLVGAKKDGNNPLMRFKQLKMLNSTSKCL